VGESGADDEVSVEVLGKKSIREDESLDTETLAVVLEKQGKYDRAIGVYEKLIAKYPEKSSTFAIRISELKIKMDNK
jgi:tetratricopeptide (TPR) repeat protein